MGNSCKLYKLSTLLIATLILPLTALFPQENIQEIKIDEYSNTSWLTLGVGLITGEDDLGGVGMIEYSVQNMNKLQSGRVLITYYCPSGCDVLSTIELSYLYGRATMASSVHAAASIGPSIMIIPWLPFGSEFKYFSPGLTFSSQVFLRGPNMGLGLYLTGGINLNYPYVGLCASLQFGKLRKRDP